jgi:hypothetical protein
MNGYLKKIVKLVIFGLALVLFQACSVKMPVGSPTASENAYNEIGKKNEIKLQYTSNLDKEYSVAAGNMKNVFILEHNNKKINADEYVKSALEKEIKARKMPFQIISDADDKLTLDNFEIITHRVSGFSPLVTVSTLKLNMNIGEDTKTFVSVVKRAKVPVWGMNEVIEPCYNEPASLLIKEIVAKINKKYIGHKFNDKYVDDLKFKISANESLGLTYLDVYELGFSNNSKAIGYLRELTSNKYEYIRLAAISSIGILGNEKEFDFLVSLNKNSKLWQDRAMALKSIGDLDIKKSHDYLTERRNFWQGKTTNEAIWNLKIIDLYI